MENLFYVARKNANLTQQAVADILGIQKTAVSKWETGRTLPDGRMLKRVSQLYNVSSDYLLGLSEQTPGIFDDARVPKSEIQELYDAMSPDLQARLLAYAYGLLARVEVTSSPSVKKTKRA